MTKVAEKKTPTKKRATGRKKAAARPYNAEQIHAMVEEAAFLAAEQDGFRRPPSFYWADAEASVQAKIDK